MYIISFSNFLSSAFIFAQGEFLREVFDLTHAYVDVRGGGGGGDGAEGPSGEFLYCDTARPPTTITTTTTAMTLTTFLFSYEILLVLSRISFTLSFVSLLWSMGLFSSSVCQSFCLNRIDVFLLLSRSSCDRERGMPPLSLQQTLVLCLLLFSPVRGLNRQTSSSSSPSSLSP